jgi:hypothetical protein
LYGADRISQKIFRVWRTIVGSDNEEKAAVLATSSQVITPWNGAQAIIAGNRYPATALETFAGEAYVDITCAANNDSQSGYLIIADENPTLGLDHGVANAATIARFPEWNP